MSLRPPVGFIVEGHGEYNCYPSLFSRIVKAKGIHVPIINAGGCGNVLRHLKEQLNDLFCISNPLNVIVTLDLEDILKEKIAESCAEVLEIMNKEVNEWLISAQDDERLHPLPNNIVCVLQIRKFESWIISDTKGLKAKKLIEKKSEDIDDAESVRSPNKWLKDNLLIHGNVKSPVIAKKVISSIRPDVMRKNSPSFDKFFRESVLAYESWIVFYYE